MSRYKLVRPPEFEKQVEERCQGLERLDEYLEGLYYELGQNPTLYAVHISPEWPRYARILGDREVWWKCLVEWYVKDDEVTLFNIYRVRE